MISWPLYDIPRSIELVERNNIIEGSGPYHDEYIIDNKNFKGKTLAMRRIRLREFLRKDPEIKLLPLNKCSYTLTDVISSNLFNWTEFYIDSTGLLHSFKNQKRRELKYFFIENINIHDSNLYCYCRGLTAPIVVKFIPEIMPRWLGLVYLNNYWCLYDLSFDKKEDSWRKI